MLFLEHAKSFFLTALQEANEDADRYINYLKSTDNKYPITYYSTSDPNANQANVVDDNPSGLFATNLDNLFFLLAMTLNTRSLWFIVRK